MNTETTINATSLYNIVVNSKDFTNLFDTKLDSTTNLRSFKSDNEKDFFVLFLIDTEGDDSAEVFYNEYELNNEAKKIQFAYLFREAENTDSAFDEYLRDKNYNEEFVEDAVAWLNSDSYKPI